MDLQGDRYVIINIYNIFLNHNTRLYSVDGATVATSGPSGYNKAKKVALKDAATFVARSLRKRGPDSSDEGHVQKRVWVDRA